MGRLALAVVMALAVSTCSTARGPTPTQPAAPWRAVAQDAWKDTFQLTLFVQRDTATPGEPFRVRAQVDNVSGKPAEYTTWNAGDPPVYLAIEPPSGDAILLRSPGDQEIVLPVVTVSVLQPGKSVIREVSWDGSVPATAERVAAPKGTYTLRARFYPGRAKDAGERSALTLAYAFQVKGG